MLPTPSLSHLSKEDFNRVYEPAEDTFILLDALEADAERLRQEKPRLVVEIGSGSGCVSAFVAAILGDSEAAYICTDLNPHAALCTSKTGKANAARLEPVLTNLLSCLLPRIQGRRRSASTERSAPSDEGHEDVREDETGTSGLVDLLLFNPPYVPTSEEEEALAQQDRSLSGSWAGGSLGTKLLYSLIGDVGQSVTSPRSVSDGEEEGEVGSGEAVTDMTTSRPRPRRKRRQGGIESILSPQGHFYCVAIRQNDPQDIVRRLEARGLAAEVVLDRKAGREHLFIIRGSKQGV